MSHYICTGDCQGISDKPGSCQANTCQKYNKPLTECDCSDNKHSTRCPIQCPIQNISPKHYFLITKFIFLIIGILHLLRIIFNWKVTINEVEIALWPSWLIVIIAGYLSYQACKLSKDK